MTSPNSRRPPGFSTRAIHAHGAAPPISSRPISMPIHQTASFEFDDIGQIGEALATPDAGFVYSRLSNPTVDLLERALADLEGTDAGIGFASGMAAIHATLVALVSAGEHVIAPVSLYGGTFALLTGVLARLGIETSFVDLRDAGALERAFRPTTRVVYAETIGNPALGVVDLPEIAAEAHRRGASFVVDSTFASPYLCRPSELGADVVIHSASKYLGGHGDLIAGMVAGSAAVVRKIRRTSADVGGTMAPFVAWLILRGLKTLSLRMERASASAARIARMLADHPRVERAIYPGLDAHPDHQVARRLLPLGQGAMVALEVRGSKEDATAFINRLRFFKRAGSLGDAHSLASQPAATSHRQLNGDQLRAAGISERFIRLSIGLEDVEDLIADLDEALR